MTFSPVKLDGMADELWMKIFYYMGPADLIRISHVCSGWHKLMQDKAYLPQLNSLKLYSSRIHILPTSTKKGKKHDETYNETKEKIQFVVFSPEYNLLAWKSQKNRHISICHLGSPDIHPVEFHNDSISNPFWAANDLVVPSYSQISRINCSNPRNPHINLIEDLPANDKLSNPRAGKIATYNPNPVAKTNLVLIFDQGRVKHRIVEDKGGNKNCFPKGFCLEADKIYIIYTTAQDVYHLSVFSVADGSHYHRLDLEKCPSLIVSSKKGLLLINDDLQVHFFDSEKKELNEVAIHLGKKPKKVFLQEDVLIAEMQGGALQIYNIATNDHAGTFPRNSAANLCGESIIAFGDDGRMAVANADGHAVEIYDPAVPKLLHSFNLGKETPSCLAFANGKETKDNYLFVGFNKGDIGIWFPSLPKGKDVPFIDPNPPPVPQNPNDNGANDGLNWFEILLYDIRDFFLDLWDCITGHNSGEGDA